MRKAVVLATVLLLAAATAPAVGTAVGTTVDAPVADAAMRHDVTKLKALLRQGADVNAAPVPSSRDTALTIAADKGH